MRACPTPSTPAPQWPENEVKYCERPLQFPPFPTTVPVSLIPFPLGIHDNSAAAPLRLAENGTICVGVVQRRPADPGDRVDPAEEGGPDGWVGPDELGDLVCPGAPDGPVDPDGRDGPDGLEDPGGLDDLSDLVCPGAPDARCDPVDPAERDALDGRNDPGGLSDLHQLDGPGAS